MKISTSTIIAAAFLFVGSPVQARVLDLPQDQVPDQNATQVLAPDDFSITGHKIFECERLPDIPQNDVRWNHETATQAKCSGRKHIISRYWSITLPNDKIFDAQAMRKKGAHHCAESVWSEIPGGLTGCINAFGVARRTCTLGDDGVAHLTFKCPFTVDQKDVNKAFHKATCNAFPEMECYNEN